MQKFYWLLCRDSIAATLSKLHFVQYVQTLHAFKQKIVENKNRVYTI